MAISTVFRCGSVRFDLRDITVEPVFFLYMFAISINFPTLQALSYYKVCVQKYNDSFCHDLKNATFQKENMRENDYVQSNTSYWILLGNVCMTVPAVFTVVLFLSSFGDKVGRKFPVMLPIIGAIVQSLASLLNSVYPMAPLPLLMIGPLISGTCGGIIASFMAVFSYVTHIAPRETRTMRLGFAESMVFLSGTLGVFVSGVMLDRTSFVFVFGFTAGVQCLALTYLVLWVDDIKPSEPLEEAGGSKGCSCVRWMWESLKDMIEFVKKPRGPRVRFVIFLLVSILNLLLLSTVGQFDVLLLFLRREPLAWSQTLFGYFKGMENLLHGLVLIVALPLFKHKLHMRDTLLAAGGVMSKVGGLILLGLSTQTWMVFFAGVVGMGQGLPSAGIRSMMSSLVNRDEQGRLFGLVAAAESLVAVVAALLFNTVYPQTLHFFPGFSFIMAAAICVLAFIMLVYLHRTGAAELCALHPYDTMEEDTDGGDGGEPIGYESDTFNIAVVADESHFAYMP